MSESSMECYVMLLLSMFIKKNDSYLLLCTSDKTLTRKCVPLSVWYLISQHKTTKKKYTKVPYI